MLNAAPRRPARTTVPSPGSRGSSSSEISSNCGDAPNARRACCAPDAQHVVADAADRGADAERDGAADDAGAAAHRELPDERPSRRSARCPHDRLRQAARDHLAPVRVRLTPMPVACDANWRTRSTPSRPMSLRSSPARVRGAGFSTCRPWSSATDWAKRAVASRNPPSPRRRRERHARADAGHHGGRTHRRRRSSRR